MSYHTRVCPEESLECIALLELIDFASMGTMRRILLHTIAYCSSHLHFTCLVLDKRALNCSVVNQAGRAINRLGFFVWVPRESVGHAAL